MVSPTDPSCSGGGESLLGRELTSVSEDPSSAFLLSSFATPGSSTVSQDGLTEATIADSRRLESTIQCSIEKETIQDTAMSMPLAYEYNTSCTVVSKEVSLMSTDSGSSMDASEYGEPVSPTFSIVTSTGGQSFSPDVPCQSLNNATDSGLPQGGVSLDDVTESIIDPISPTDANTETVTKLDSEESKDDGIREEVEIRWLPDLAVEHSFRPPTPRKAWGSSPVTPVDRIPYVHGSYASAAPLMVYNKKWMQILRRLMPANHADAMEILREAEEALSRRSNNDQQMARLMKWAENNPVVAAYGMLNSNSGAEPVHPTTTLDHHASTSRFSRRSRGIKKSESRKDVPVLEWDVFLDPTLVKKVDAAMDAAEQVKHDESADYQDQIAADIEVDRQVGRLINRMMLAHGSASHLVSEALGVASQYNFTKLVEQGESQRLYRRKEAEKKWKRSGLHFSRNGMDIGGRAWVVREQAQAALMNFDSHRQSVIAGKASAKPAGIFVERWLVLFLRAIHIAKATEGALSFGHFYLEDDESTPQVEPEADKTRPPMCGMFLCLGIEDPNASKVDHAKTSMATTAKQIEESLGSPLRVILDLKSRRVPARVWARVIDNMRSRGLLIEGLGSFDVDEIRSVRELCASNVTEVRFFHSAGDLQKACHAKEVCSFVYKRWDPLHRFFLLCTSFSCTTGQCRGYRLLQCWFSAVGKAEQDFECCLREP